MDPQAASDAQQCVWVLENGSGLRDWVEQATSGIRIQQIKCATFAVGSPGLLWLVGLARRRHAHLQILSDEGQTNPTIAPLSLLELISDGQAQWHAVAATPGPLPGKEGWFHPKILLFDDRIAVVGSANLTGCGLGLSIPPHHTEMSVGFRGPGAQAALAAC